MALDEGKKLPGDYPRFEPAVYSIDVFVPFLDLHQEDYWLSTANSPVCSACFGTTLGQWVRIYMWLHIAFGWLLSTLAALSITGLVRRE
jgi:hypothetical protein